MTDADMAAHWHVNMGLHFGSVAPIMMWTYVVVVVVVVVDRARWACRTFMHHALDPGCPPKIARLRLNAAHIVNPLHAHSVTRNPRPPSERPCHGLGGITDTANPPRMGHACRVGHATHIIGCLQDCSVEHNLAPNSKWGTLGSRAQRKLHTWRCGGPWGCCAAVLGMASSMASTAPLPSNRSL